MKRKRLPSGAFGIAAKGCRAAPLDRRNNFLKRFGILWIERRPVPVNDREQFAAILAAPNARKDVAEVLGRIP